MTKLTINGTQYDIDLPDDTPLLWVLRDQLGLTGTKFGCGMALCGACTIHIDGQPGRACVTPISALALLKKKSKPTDADIDEAMAGNICRCGTYGRIRAAIKQAGGKGVAA